MTKEEIIQRFEEERARGMSLRGIAAAAGITENALYKFSYSLKVFDALEKYFEGGEK